MSLEMFEDGTFALNRGGEKVKLRIYAVVTGDDVLRAYTNGIKTIAARLILPEAYEVAKKVGVELINIEEVVGPLVDLIEKLLKSRRGDLLAKIFSELLPYTVARSYSYTEYMWDQRLKSVTFSVEVKLSESTAMYYEDLSELFSAIAAKASTKNFWVKHASEVKPTYAGKEYMISLSANTDL